MGIETMSERSARDGYTDRVIFEKILEVGEEMKIGQ